MEALQLLAGAFLIIAGCCIIAWATGYSPERSVKKRIEKCEKTLAEMEARLEQIQGCPESPEQKEEEEILRNMIHRQKKLKADLEEILSIPNQ